MWLGWCWRFRRIAYDEPRMVALLCRRARLVALSSALASILVLVGCTRSPSPPSLRILVSDEPGGNVIIVDPDAGTVVDKIPVGKRPRGIKMSRDGKQVFVALSGSPIAGPGVDESTLP